MGLIDEYKRVRSGTMEIVKPLEIEDYVVQTAPFMSPPRWHLGHTSWFFEMLLREFATGYRVYCEEYLFYFNSYYERFGSRIKKEHRGVKSRPTVKETIEYRLRIDDAMLSLLGSIAKHPRSEEVLSLTRLGLEHEMQHQELLVYDIKHLLADLYSVTPDRTRAGSRVDGMVDIEGGLFEVGHSDSAFAYDNEKPSHTVFLQDFAIDLAPVSNRQFLAFVKAGGYEDHRWWYSEAWGKLNEEGWQAPMYWEQHGDRWMIRDFAGLHPVEDKGDEPVSHVSFYEASAFAKWAGKRLPTETEWEKAACYDPNQKRRLRFPWGDSDPGAETANLFENRLWGVSEAGSLPAGRSPYGCVQMIGDVWEWTSSDYAPYPGFKTEFDEYNDKWFVGQKVLRGGSFATPRSHIRTTYRNFFCPHERWMIAGFRCAKYAVAKS
jgi:ergothioneine biosynthesis protein EgtB